MVEREGVERLGAHETEVRVVVDEARAEEPHYFIVGAGGVALHEGVRRPARAHAADYVRARGALFRHRVYGPHVVLQIGVYGDGDGAALPRAHEPLGEGRLMPAVAVKPEPGEARVALVGLADKLPGPVGGAVVHKEHPAVVGGIAARGELGEAFAEAERRYGQHLFFVVAGYYDKVSFHFALRKEKTVPTL